MRGRPTLRPPERPPGRFWGLVAIIAGLQAGLLLLFGECDHKAPDETSAPSYFHLLATPLNADQLSKTFFAIDPTVFPLPGLHGFSERAWLNLAPPQFDAPSQTEEPAWLSLDINRLGTDFPQLHEPKTGLPFGLAVPPAAELEPWPAFLAPEKFSTESTFAIRGPLEARRLNGPATLPARTNALLLSNSVVQIAVDSAGQVIAARLLGRSGSVNADNAALEQARNLRFQPSSSPVAVWGNAVFAWQTVAPANAGAAAAP